MGEKIDWMDAIRLELLRYRENHFSDEITLNKIYDFSEDRLSKRFPDNKHVRSKIRQTLQRLRDKHEVEFIDYEGTYKIKEEKIIKSIPNHIENQFETKNKTKKDTAGTEKTIAIDRFPLSGVENHKIVECLDCNLIGRYRNKIAKEIAKNHAKQKNHEVRVSKYYKPKQSKKKTQSQEKQKSDNRFEKIDVNNKKFIELIKKIDSLYEEIDFKVDKNTISFYYPEIKKGNGITLLGYPKTNKIKVYLRGLKYPEKVDHENRIKDGGWQNSYKTIRIELKNQDIEYLLDLIEYAIKKTDKT
ncbi:hypothetical protein [Methanonatronarchaeum sp. AMET6-2]|uniref:hypothetical protein n=1 Tax=Methanonatronarchaeum sp. AMET6-2 TaxID=2933293 RepID=UPI001FF381E1|nr:hypothetical protein [Methanonatronarchaeum sp. AMET6-2]UOY10014.1 hypothetical protein MU439_07075 [Methanonatronarchaeum sp. AMET6-2]